MIWLLRGNIIADYLAPETNENQNETKQSPPFVISCLLCIRTIHRLYQKRHNTIKIQKSKTNSIKYKA